ncbi:hypothetical protein NXX23_20945 [Bacteroides ovatus]|nr:hypothetical protein [Bacteroides ovatus]
MSHRNKLNLAGKPFSYGASFNLTFARNRYLRYPDSPNTVEWRKRTGRSVDASVVWVAGWLIPFGRRNRQFSPGMALVLMSVISNAEI